MEDVIEMCAFGDNVANPVARPLECAEFYGGEVRKDEADNSVGTWKADRHILDPRSVVQRSTFNPPH